MDIKSAQRNESKSSAKVKSYEEEVESLKSKLTDAEAQMLDIEKNAKLCMEEFQGLQKTVGPTCTVNMLLRIDPRIEPEDIERQCADRVRGVTPCG